MADLRAQLLRIQRENYEKNLRLVKASYAGNAAVTKYGREYHAYLKSYQSLSNKGELFRRILNSDIVYHGDYHTLRHSQRSILAILQELAHKREVILCLEMFHGSDQKWVDLFMQGGLDEKVFLNKIAYAKKWAYNWNPWKHILDFCRKNEIKVLGINSIAQKTENSLVERDIYSAQVIGQALIRHRGALVYVVDGDYHISPNHLPREVESRLKPLGLNPTRTIIYQNAENLYWKLAEERKEEADILQIQVDAFCLMNTVPATKLQSYLDWLEFAEDGYFPVSGNWAELSGENYFAQIQNIVENLDSLFQLKFPMESLEKLSVYSSRNLDFTEIIQNTPILRGQLRLVKEKIKRGEGFLLQAREESLDLSQGDKVAGVNEMDSKEVHETFVIYLPNSSINQAAEEATHFIHAILRGPLQHVPKGHNFFYTNLITEALGFFGSKMINEKRKVPTESSLRSFLGKVKQGQGASLPNQGELVKISRLLLQHLHLEKRSSRELDFRKKFMDIYSDRGSLPQIFSTQLGYMLGNRLYYAVKKGAIPLRDIRGLFYARFETSGEAFATYLRLLERLKTIRLSQDGLQDHPPRPLAASA